jgi:hypothetical protein
LKTFAAPRGCSGVRIASKGRQPTTLVSRVVSSRVAARRNFRILLGPDLRHATCWSAQSAMYDPPSPKRPLQPQVVALLRRRTTVPGQIIEASYQDLAEELGNGFTARDVRVVLLELGRASYFLGRPHLSDREFRGRLAW